MIAACGGGGRETGEPDAALDAPSADASPDGPSVADKHGRFSIRQRGDADSQGTNYLGEFRDGDQALARRTDGPCAIATGLNLVGTPRVTSIGPITVTGALGSAHTLIPDQGIYQLTSTDLIYSSGEAIEIAGTGLAMSADFPSHTISVTEPDQPIISVDRAVGLTAAWTGTGPVLIEILQSSGQGVLIRCAYDGVSTATVPPSTLSDLSATTNFESAASITIAAGVSTSVISGAFEVELDVLSSGDFFTGEIL
jgi:hypothetical protein